METQVQAAQDAQGAGQQSLQRVPEHTAWVLPGLRMLVISSAVLIVGIVLLVVAGIAVPVTARPCCS